MTDKEKRVEMLRELLTTNAKDGVLETSFGEYRTMGEVFKKMGELVGRPVYTHEAAFPEMLYDEIMSGREGEAFGRSLREIAKTKPVFGVVAK